jgi:acetoin utilization deacetylase AcuC-like enzyme
MTTQVAILDFDVHHGNGDESIAWDDASRLYASSHQVLPPPSLALALLTPGDHTR